MPGLDDLYREVILDHYRNPRNRGELPEPASKVEAFNPLCGDEVILHASFDDGKLTDIKIQGHGCAISQSSASMMTAAVKGKGVTQVEDIIKSFKTMMSIHEQEIDDGDGTDPEITEEETAEPDAGEIDLALGDLEALKGVVKFPVRIKCATLAWNALAQAIEEAPE